MITVVFVLDESDEMSSALGLWKRFTRRDGMHEYNIWFYTRRCDANLSAALHVLFHVLRQVSHCGF